MNPLRSVLGRVGLLLALLFGLVAVSVTATFWGLRAQADDALVINLAGRQRMLVQQMTRLAVEVGQGEEEHRELKEAADRFAETLLILQEGGPVQVPAGIRIQAPRTRDAEIIGQLGRIEQVWDRYRSEVEQVLALPPASPQAQGAIASIRVLSPQLVAEADAAVRLFQADSDRRIQRLSWIQAGFFLSALLLLIIGGLVIHRSVLAPLINLGRSAEHIGKGDLETPVRIEGPDEIQRLSGALEVMRADLSRSRQELVQWNRTLEARVHERTRELEALHEVSREISSRLDLEQALKIITDSAQGSLKAETALLCLLDPGEQELSLQAFSGPDGTIDRAAAAPDQPFVQTILSNRCAQRCRAKDFQATCGILQETYRASHLASSLWVEGRVIGALCVGSRRPDAFSAEAPQLLTRLAGAAAVAIENARLYQQAERLATLEERQRTAASMHDGLAQMVDSLGLLVDQADDALEVGETGLARRALERARLRAEAASGEVRRAIASLDAEPSLPGSLQEQLQSLLEGFASQDEAGIQWRAELEGGLYLPGADAQQVVGIAREALANARRHSGAKQVHLRLIQTGEAATLVIEDDGCGFDPRVLPGGERRHFGLKILTARAAQLGGRLEVRSVPGCGTRISLSWPVRHMHPAWLSRQEKLPS